MSLIFCFHPSAFIHRQKILITLFCCVVAIPVQMAAGDCFASARNDTLGATSEEAQPADIGEVEVGASRDHESAEMPAAFTTVIKPERFERRTKSAAEVLSETAGVDVTTLGGEGSLSTVSIRGSSAEEVAVFVDGVRINSALYGSVNFATIPIDSIERIEVIRGAASARFGTDAIGGVINIVTKKAGGKRAIDLKLTGASFDTLHTSESWSEPHDKWSLVLAHNHRSTAGDFTFRSAGISLAGGTVADPKTYTRFNNRSVAEDVLAKGDVDLTELMHLSASNDFFWTDAQVPTTEIETTLLFPANPLEAHEEIFRDTAGLRAALDRLFVDGLSLKSGVSNAYIRDHFTDPSPAIGDPIDVTSVGVSPEAYLELMHSADAGPASFTTVLRYQYRYDHSDDSSPYPTAPLAGEHGRSTNAAFLEEEVDLFGDKLRVIPSGRVETASDRTTRASWRAGAVGSPVEWIDIKANVGTAFRYPTFMELYFPDQGYLRGNPNLNDERSFNWDAGVIVRPPRSSIEISYYQNRIYNQIMFVPVSATTIQPINTGRVNSHGIEATVTAEPWKWMRLDANYTWLDAIFASNGLKLPGRPQHKANAHLELKTGWASIFGEVQYVGSYPLNTSNTVTISSHVAANAGTTIAFAKHFFFTFEVKDVNNVQIYDARGFPLPRRSYWVSVGAKT